MYQILQNQVQVTKMYHIPQQNQAQTKQKQNYTPYVYRFERHHSIDDICFILQELPTKVLALYFLLVRYAKRYRTVYPSLAKLSRETGFSKTTIIRYIEMLEAVGLLTVYRRKGTAKNRDLSNLYYFPPIVLCKKFTAMIFGFCRYAYYMTVRDSAVFLKGALVRMWTLYKSFINGCYCFKRSFLTFESLSSESGEASLYAFGGNAPSSLSGDGNFVENWENECDSSMVSEMEPFVESKAYIAAREALRTGCYKVRATYMEMNRLQPGRFNENDIQQRINQYIQPYLSDCSPREIDELRSIGLL